MLTTTMRLLLRLQRCCILLLALFSSSCLALSSPGPTTKKVAVIGATGKLGREAVTKLSSAGVPVNCLVRFNPASVESGPKFTDANLESASSDDVRRHLKALPGVELIRGDATSLSSLKELTQGCTAVLALHGATRMSKLSDIWNNDKAEQEPNHAKQINYEGISTLIQACNDSPTCKRIVRITGKGEDPSSFFSVLINMLGSMAKGWNYEGECLLRNQNDVDYTIIRPGVMKSMERTPNEAVLGLKDNGQDMKVTPVAYGDIADLTIQCLDYPNAARSTLTAMNVENGKGATSYAPLLAKVQPDSRDFPSSLINEHKAAVKKTVMALAVVFATLTVGVLSVIKSWIFG